jgi:hypothetical protein
MYTAIASIAPHKIDKTGSGIFKKGRTAGTTNAPPRNAAAQAAPRAIRRMI